MIKRMVGDERLPLLPSRRESFENELRIGKLLNENPPPVRAPLLLAADPGAGVLVFSAFDGAPLGPKRPRTLTVDDLDRALLVAERLSTFDPRPDWLQRLPVEAIIDHHRGSVLTKSQHRRVVELVESGAVRWGFAHGDLSPRNILKAPDGAVAVIDWERAGLYPAAYDFAFFWFCANAVPAASARIEAAVAAADREGFWLSALMVGLLHIGPATLDQAKADTLGMVAEAVQQLVATAG